MKTLHLKLYSLIAVVLLSVSAVFAYQTLAFDFPIGAGNWHVAYHQTIGNETIVQYVPSGESYEHWSKTLIIHSYRYPRQNSAAGLLRTVTGQLETLNSYSKYVYLRATVDDAIATRCVVSNTKMKAQCDIYRAMTSFNGFITMQYINRSQENFKSNYMNWLEAIRNAKPYQAAFRNDRYMSKDNFEL